MTWDNVFQAFKLGACAGMTVFGFLVALVVLTGVLGFVVNLIVGLVRGKDEKA